LTFEFLSLALSFKIFLTVARVLIKRTLKREWGVDIPYSKHTSPFEDSVYLHHAPSHLQNNKTATKQELGNSRFAMLRDKVWDCLLILN